MIIKGEALIKVSFTNHKVAANAFTFAAIIQSCFRQVYARAPLSKTGIDKKANFKVVVLN